MSNANSRSRFSKAQDDVIASYYPEFVKILGTGREASWKADTAKKIIALPLFANLLTTEEDPVRGTSHAGWEERVRKKFGNHKTQTVKPSASSAQSAGSEKGFFGRPKLSAWMLFGVEQKEAIDAGAQSLATEAGKTNTLPFYQTSKKRLWDALTEDEKVEVAGRALRHHQDADLNQEAFRLSIWQDMQDFAKSGIYGDMTMTLLYGFRTAKGSMFCGSSSVNLIPEGKGFGETPGFSSSTWQAFSAFAEDALPVSVKDETQYDIPVDDEGTPVFPAINMNATALGVLNVFIKRYLEILWMHCRPLDGSFSPEIAAAHYDKTRFVLPVAMERVDSLTPGEIVTLSEFFKGLTDSGPFVFRGDAEEGGDEEPPANEDEGEPKKTAKHRTVESQKADDDGLVVNAVQSGKKGDSIGDGEESVQPAKAKPKGKPKAKKGAGGAKGLKPAKKALAKRAYQPDSTEEPARPSKKTRLAVDTGCKALFARRANPAQIRYLRNICAISGFWNDFEVRHQIGTGDLSDALTSREQRAGIGEGGGAECLGRLQPTHGMLRAAGVRAELVRLSRTPPPDRRARHARFLVRFAHPRCITPSTHQRSSPLLRVAGFSSLSVRRTAARAFTPRVYIIDPARILGGHVNPEQALAVASPRIKTCASTSPSGSSSLKSFALVCTLGSDASTWPESAARAYTAVAYSIAATPPLSSKECVERPDLNADKTIFVEDGWFRTGDVGQWNADGTLTLIDRCVRGATIGERAIECGLCGCRLVVGARRWESGGAPAGKYAERTETGIRATAERVKGYSGIPPGLDNHVIYLLFAQD
ncbi:hypothetical protein K438DRAFT_1987880 [Mycena galopus ATCC 62051]|nr:hypothetical protein K438DRAFT_1987880 [Mycena galopus ATCC 62051]